MKIKFSRSVQVYYSTILLFLCLGLGAGFWYFWQKGAVNSEMVTAAYEASLRFDEIKSKNYAQGIKELVDSDRVRDAVKKMEILETETRFLDSVSPIESYPDFKKELQITKKNLNDLISYPELSSVFLVFSNKISNFETFVVSNNWRTLTRVTRRIQAKIQPSRVRTPGFFSYGKLKTLAKSIENDINLMSKVTEGSVLGTREKNIIEIKLNTLNTELKMTFKYLDSLEEFNSTYRIFQKRYDTWMTKVAPAISLKKIEIERNFKTLFFGILGMMAFLVLAFITGLSVYSRSERSNEKKLEQIVNRVIQDGLIPVSGSKIDFNFSSSFMKDFEKFREYIHKRMSFGSVFQDAVPFSSFLLDSNLNVVWGNNLFYQQWSLDERGSDMSVSWDYLQQFTNLGEDDPVLTALNQGIAGIYNIQIRDVRGNSEAQPYEMYVSPVEYSGQKRIMIFLYPLRSLEDTLTHQTKAIVGPVSRSLDALTRGMYNQEFKEKIGKDFDIAGIHEIYEKFNTYNDFVNQQRTGLLHEIEKLENELFDKIKLVDDLRTINESDVVTRNGLVNSFNEAKIAVVSTIDLRYEIENSWQDSLNSFKELLRTNKDILTLSEKANTILDENKKAFEGVTGLRTDFKQIKANLDEFRSQILRTLDQTLIHMKGKNSEDVVQSLNKVKVEVKGFDKSLYSLGEIVKNLDVTLSKVEMILLDSEAPDFEQFIATMTEMKDKLDDDIFNMGRIGRLGELADDKVISSLKNLYTGFQQSKEHQAAVHDLIASDIASRDYHHDDSDTEFEVEELAEIDIILEEEHTDFKMGEEI